MQYISKKFFTGLFALSLAVTCAAPVQAEGLRLTFEKRLQMTQLTTGAAPSASEQSVEQVVTIYPEAYSSRGGQSENIYDFKEKTFTVVNHSAKNYLVYPLQTVALMRSRDRLNRLGMKISMYQQQASTAHIPTNILMQDVDIDMILGTESGNTTADKIRPQKDGEKTVYSDGKTPLAIVSASTEAVPQTLRKAYALFVTYEFLMHPAIKKPLGAQSSVFKSLEYTNRDMFRNLAATHSWALKNAARTEETAPEIPEDYTRIYHSDSQLDAAFKQALEPFTFDPEAFQAEVRTLIDQNKYLVAFLRAQAVQAMMAPKDVAAHQAAFATANRAAQNFERAAHLAIIQSPDTVTELRQYNDILEKSKPRAGDLTGMLEYYMAMHTRNVLGRKQALTKSETEQLAATRGQFTEAIKKFPHLVKAYRQMGDIHFAALEIPLAALYWSHLERIAPQSESAKAGLAMLAQVEKDFPEYFLR